MKTCALIVFLVFSGVAFGHKKPYAFELADRLVEELSAQVTRMEQEELSFNYTARQQISVSATFEEELLFKTADEFDFIIIGGGAAGSVLASRLSEVPEWKILLLEAGDKDSDASRIPRNWEQLTRSSYTWGYKTTPQNYTCWNSEDHTCTIPLGRMLGGSSATSNMLYTRGHLRDYDLWADYGNKNWCYADVLPTFKKIENAEINHYDKAFHRYGGLQKLENSKFATSYREGIFQAAHELGLKTIDYNGKDRIGVSIPQLTINCGTRSSAYNSYLEQCTERPNLVIQPLSEVLKIAIKPHLKEAQGVFYLYNNQLRAAKANKEVILTAGALNTPNILLHSGVGPKEVCQKIDVENIVDLPVGKNLKVRPTFVGLNFRPKEAINVETNKFQEFESYLKLGTGRLTSPGIEAVIYKKCGKDRTHPDDYPDVELQVLEKQNDLSIVVTLNHPFSSGYVTLQSKEFLTQPIIDPNLLGDEEGKDFDALFHGIKDAVKLSQTQSFQSLGLEIDQTPVEACKELEFGSDDYWKCAIKFLTIPTGDATGTARMGPNDEHHVVDSELKVRGVYKLRIADASVIPVPITGNLIAPSMMIGEKAAELILNYWLN